MRKTRRVKIVTGLKCNIQCVFCYYRDNLNAPNRSVKAILEDVSYAYRHGIREIDFSGGEPTVHPDLVRLIAEAKQLGMETVSIISNGWRLTDRGYMDQLRDAGLDEVLFSIHGADAEIHDAITCRPGSFGRILSAIENAADSGLSVRTNTVVNKVNYRSLLDLCRLIIPFKPDQVNFITVNDWCYAQNLVDALMLSYQDMAPYLQNACLMLEPDVPAVNVRYIPFCFMEGFERFVCNHRQVPYDPYEWLPHVRCRLELQNTFLRYIAIISYGLLVGGAWRRVGATNLRDLLDEAVTEGLRRRFYVKRSSCDSCRYAELCDGVEKTYAAAYGLDELQNVAGDMIDSPVHFRRKP